MSTWKRIPGNDGYKVSETGEIKNRVGHTIRTIWKRTRNCYTVNLAKPGGGVKTYTVGSLVLEAFLGAPNNWRDRKVGYKDGDHRNNRLDNLYFIEDTSKNELPEVLDDDGVLLLWKAMCQQVIADLYYGAHSRGNEDMLHAKSAKRFLEKDLWIYLGDEPDPKRISQAYEKAKTWTPHKIIRTSLTKTQQEAVETYTPPEWKKRCTTCKYSSLVQAGVTPAKRERYILCNYIIATGRKRPCRGGNCTVFMKRG